jgi:hypothetical protein
MKKERVAATTLDESNRGDKYDRHGNVGKWNDAAGRQELQ